MLLPQLRLPLARAALVGRAFSTSSELVKVELNESIAVLTMQNGPVNSLSLEMCQALSQSIQTAEADPTIQGLVLTSSSPSVFSAGLDLVSQSASMCNVF
jgi:enoyl-CoA hydratase/carnithine racemase